MDISKSTNKSFSWSRHGNVTHKDELEIIKESIKVNCLKNTSDINNPSYWKDKLVVAAGCGGGLKINSGCFGSEFKDILVSVQVIDKKGNIKTIPCSGIKFGYRQSPLDKDFIFLSASFKGKIKEKNEIEKIIKKLKNQKDEAQPTKIKTGGSTFKNPIEQTNIKVWELIKNSVPLESKFGDAKISNKHCNFLVNSSEATFNDMKKLIEFVRKNVRLKTGIKLETEIEIIE